MTTLVRRPGRTATASRMFLLAGIVLGALSEAIASTALSLGRGDIIGDIYATPDQFSWLDVGYTSLKLIGFVLAPWLMARFGSRNLILLSVLALGAACGLAAITARLEILVALRTLQGLAGGVLLVAGQATLFLCYARGRQPVIQAVFAVGAVVAPTTIAPALQGWLLDSQSWSWIFSSIVPVSLASVGCVLLAGDVDAPVFFERPFDWAGVILISIAVISSAYVLNQGNRWNWFEEPRIPLLTVVSFAGLLAFLGREMLDERRRILEYGAFRSSDFTFAFFVSFVAGAALFGSAYLIPAFAVSVLAFTPTGAGLLLLPSGALFVGALLVAAYLMQARGVPPLATVPIGILLTMAAMWMLAGSSSESGVADMMSAILLRGAGLGCLFLSISLIAFWKLDRTALVSGIALFDVARQFGGLAGVAGLQTLIDHQAVANYAILSASVASGSVIAADRLMTGSALLTGRGLDMITANQAAIDFVTRAVKSQSMVIAFDTAFAAIAVLFIVAAPLLVAIRIVLARCKGNAAAK